MRAAPCRPPSTWFPAQSPSTTWSSASSPAWYTSARLTAVAITMSSSWECSTHRPRSVSRTLLTPHLMRNYKHKHKKRVIILHDRRQQYYKKWMIWWFSELLLFIPVLFSFLCALVQLLQANYWQHAFCFSGLRFSLLFSDRKKEASYNTEISNSSQVYSLSFCVFFHSILLQWLTNYQECIFFPAKWHYDSPITDYSSLIAPTPIYTGLGPLGLGQLFVACEFLDCQHI